MDQKKTLPVLLSLLLLLTGCSTSADNADSTAPAVSEPEVSQADTPGDDALSGDDVIIPEVIVPMHLYYATDHGTQDPAQLSDFLGQLEADDTTVDTGALLEFPLDADSLIINSPTEDITLEELQRIDEYFNAGGHVLLLMPAQDTDARRAVHRARLCPYRL